MTTIQQLGQQVRRDRQRLMARQFRSRQLAQQARQDREHEPIARQSLLPQLASGVTHRHRFDPCDVLCTFCGAENWIEERIQASSKTALKFFNMLSRWRC